MHILLFAILFCPLTAIQTEDVSDFIKQLDSADSGVRFNAARELTWMGAKAEPATARLLELLGDNEAPFENAIQYFGPRVNDAASGALAEIGEPAVAGLIETLKSEDITIRMKAADTLGKIGPPAARSFPMLRDLILNDPDQWVRFRGIDAIAHLGEDPEIVVPLLDQMKDDEFHSIRSAVLNSLHNADPNGTLAIPILQRELSNADPDLMANAVRGLGLYGAKSHVATEDLIKLLSTDKLRVDSYADVGYHVPVKFDVVAALGKIGPSAKNAIHALIAMAGDESEPARLTQILSAIVRIAPSENAGQQAFALLTTQLEKKSEDAATAIGEVGSDDAITLLTNALEGESSPAVLAFQTSVITAL